MNNFLFIIYKNYRDGRDIKSKIKVGENNKQNNRISY